MIFVELTSYATGKKFAVNVNKIESVSPLEANTGFKNAHGTAKAQLLVGQDLREYWVQEDYDQVLGAIKEATRALTKQ